MKYILSFIFIFFVTFLNAQVDWVPRSNQEHTKALRVVDSVIFEFASTQDTLFLIVNSITGKLDTISLNNIGTNPILDLQSVITQGNVYNGAKVFTVNKALFNDTIFTSADGNSTQWDSAYKKVLNVYTKSESISIYDSLRKSKVGYFIYYNTSNQSYTNVNNFVKLLNNGLGAKTLTAYRPTSITSIYDSTSSNFDFSELSLGDDVAITVNVNLTSSQVNQKVELVLKTPEENRSKNLILLKSGNTYNYSLTYFLPMDYNSILNNPSNLEIKSTHPITVNVVYFYIKVNRR